VPAKSNFVQLGESSLDGLFNDIAKTGNQFEAGYTVNSSYSSSHKGYSNFNVYSGQLLESANKLTSVVCKAINELIEPIQIIIAQIRRSLIIGEITPIFP
jgi:hypothetical protein